MSHPYMKFYIKKHTLYICIIYVCNIENSCKPDKSEEAFANLLLLLSVWNGVKWKEGFTLCLAYCK